MFSRSRRWTRQFYGAFIIAIVTAVVTIYSAWLGRQTLRQEAALRAKEHEQLSLDISFRLLLDLTKDYQDSYVIHNRREAALCLLKGEYSLGLQNLLDFFERMSGMVLRGALDKSMAYNSFSGRLRRYWTAAAPRIEEERMRHESPDLWEDTEKVYQLFLEMEAARIGCIAANAVPSPASVDRFLRAEASLPTTLST